MKTQFNHVGRKNSSTIPYCGQYAFHVCIDVTNGIIVCVSPLNVRLNHAVKFSLLNMNNVFNVASLEMVCNTD